MDVLGLDERHVGKIGLMKRKEDDTQYSSYHQCHMKSILFFVFVFWGEFIPSSSGFSIVSSYSPDVVKRPQIKCPTHIPG